MCHGSFQSGQEVPPRAVQVIQIGPLSKSNRYTQYLLKQSFRGLSDSEKPVRLPFKNK